MNLIERWRRADKYRLEDDFDEMFETSTAQCSKQTRLQATPIQTETLSLAGSCSGGRELLQG
jgi:hypothetical protein